MYHAMASEARSGRSKAREVSRKLARIHRGAREELSKAEDVTLWILGGVAVLGGGWLAYQALTKPAAASTTTTTTTTPGATPSPSPKTPPSPAPSTTSTPGTPPTTPATPPAIPATPPATTPAASGLTWPAGAVPWNPPFALPAASPSLQATLTDPAWIMLAQASLLAIQQVPGNNLTSVTYTGGVDGVMNSSLEAALAAWQKVINNQIASGGILTGTSVPTNGQLDFKTLAMIMAQAMSSGAANGPIAPGATFDSGLQSMALSALQNALAVNTANNSASQATFYGALTRGITSTSDISALQTFETNLKSVIGSQGPAIFPSTDAGAFARGALPLSVWAYAVSLAG